MMKKLLITGAWKCSESQYIQLRQMGYDICFLQNEKDELPEEAFGANVVICNALFLYHDIKKFHKLEAVQLTSAGFDRVSMKYIEEQGIAIYNASGVYSKPIAEFVVCGVLQLYKQSRFFLQNQKKHVWEKHRGLYELEDKTVCVIGCGSIGTECGKYFKVFGCNVIGVGRSRRSEEHFDKVVEIEQIERVLPTADIVILAIPLDESTYHIFDQKWFGLLKTSAIVVNVARGSVVDTEALIDALPNLGGAVLDVFEEEPLQIDNRLWDFENVILTPHNSFVGEKNSERLAIIILDNLKKLSKD